MYMKIKTMRTVIIHIYLYIYVHKHIYLQAGESTGKATLHTLRALHRIKLIRSSGENTYILM
jgi:hypothetical protein